MCCALRYRSCIVPSARHWYFFTNALLMSRKASVRNTVYVNMARQRPSYCCHREFLALCSRPARLRRQIVLYRWHKSFSLVQNMGQIGNGVKCLSIYHRWPGLKNQLILPGAQLLPSNFYNRCPVATICTVLVCRHKGTLLLSRRLW